MTSSEDAAKMGVEEVLHHQPATDQPRQFHLCIVGKKALEYKVHTITLKFHKCNVPETRIAISYVV